MSIYFDRESQSFHLRGGNVSYVIQIYKDEYLVHRYWGPRLHQTPSQPLLVVGRPFSPGPDEQDAGFSRDTSPSEYPCYGTSDYRMPAIEAIFANGTSALDLRYKAFTITDGKPKLAGLPSTYVENDTEAQTLVIELVDSVSGLRVELLYSIYEASGLITRSARVVNDGATSVEIRRALSMCLDLPSDDFELIQLSGAWARERHLIRRPLVAGLQAIESRRGASSHQQNPFIALARAGMTEEQGDVYGISLVYSGNFFTGAEVDQYGATRIFSGVNPFDFSWTLQPKEAFQTPEAVLVYSNGGLGGMSRLFHQVYRSRLARGVFRDAKRPVLINNWEATYFSFDASTLQELATSAADLGIELFVLDDGWFGKRDDDTTSLGDWVPHERKLPQGLAGVSDAMRTQGMQFGLWFEPEMVSPDSDLYRLHPDWCLHVPDRTRTLARHQLVLDLSRQDVREAIVEKISAVLSSAPIVYVKWDMNRNLTEVASAMQVPERQRETAHRYVLGLYQILESLCTAFPHILFESCSGGGGRFDPGMLYYMPQTWTSDNTDAIARLAIQFGTSLVYPPGAMGAHVSVVPNHQVGRVTSLKTRGLVAMMGNLGYELDVRHLTAEERQEVKEQILLYHEIQPLILVGDFYRLWYPDDADKAAWMYVAADRSEAFVTYVQILAQPNPRIQYLRLQGLDPDALYTEVNTHQTVGGDELLHLGLVVPYFHEDFGSTAWHFKRQ